MPKKKPDPDPRWTSHLKPAPGDLRRVQAFLNTASPPAETDLATPRALTDWLILWELAQPGTKLDEADLSRALEVRAALRSLVGDGGTPKEEAARILDVAFSGIRVRFGADGRTRFEPSGDGLDGALARLCGIVAAAQLEGTWTRFKICVGKTCKAVYFDASRNRSARWCSPRCGSRSSSLTYRHRNLRSIRDMDRISAKYRRRRYGVG